MDVFTSAAELLRNHRPERPVLCLRPHAAARAARWFLANFPGQVLYAAKANDASPIIEALAEAGITKFDVASSVEIARMAAVPNAELYFMNPVKSRVSIRTAFDEFGVRSFAFDSEDELDKILEETGRARDLALYLRIACPNTHSLIPLEGKFGVPMAEAPALLLRARQVAKRLGITFHVGSQAVVPAAFGEALRQVGQLIVTSGVLVDAIDIGGGFPSRYPHSDPPELSDYTEEIAKAWDELAVKDSCELLCEPGRALVAEAESVIVRVDARRGNALYVNDGAFGTLFDAAYSRFRFPARLIGASRGQGTRRGRVLALRPDLRQLRLFAGPLHAAALGARKATISRSARSAPMAACWRIVSTGSANTMKRCSPTSPCSRCTPTPSSRLPPTSL